MIKKIFSIKSLPPLGRNKILMLLMFLTFSMGICFSVNAQGPDTPVESDAPIDGGLSLLIAGGVGYGIKKVKQGKSKMKQID